MDNTIVCAETMEKPYKVHMFNMENKLRMEVQPQVRIISSYALINFNFTLRISKLLFSYLKP